MRVRAGDTLDGIAEAERHAATARVASELGMTAGGVEALGRVVADQVLAELSPVATAPAVFDAAGVARRLGVTRPWVYEHAGDLGGRRVGGRWLFTAEALMAALSPFQEPGPAAESTPTRRRSRRARSKVELLPIHERGV